MRTTQRLQKDAIRELPKNDALHMEVPITGMIILGAWLGVALAKGC